MRILWCAVAALVPAIALAEPVGQFVDHSDIGQPPAPGAASYDPATRTYTVTGLGRNMWADHDDFHFVWKRMSGDVIADTRLDFTTPAPPPGATGFLHRKGGIVLRQDLDPDSAYVDVLRMGNQQMSLQYREVKGGPTRLIWVNTARQGEVRLVKIGDYAYLQTLGADGKLHSAGGSFKLRLTGAYYIGLGVCPHDEKARETMSFRDVHIRVSPPGTRRPAGETLQTINIATVAEQTALYHSDDAPIAATGWSPDSRWVYFRGRGVARRAVAWDSDKVEKANSSGESTPAANSARLDKIAALGLAQRLSPDGQWIAYLTGAGRGATVDQDVVLHIAPVVDGKPATEKAQTLVKLWGNAASLPPSAWSPDSKSLAFVSHD
jgi:hypothetical protein